MNCVPFIKNKNQSAENTERKAFYLCHAPWVCPELNQFKVSQDNLTSQDLFQNSRQETLDKLKSIFIIVMHDIELT